jgi:hypothetical protein
LCNAQSAFLFVKGTVGKNNPFEKFYFQNRSFVFLYDGHKAMRLKKLFVFNANLSNVVLAKRLQHKY